RGRRARVPALFADGRLDQDRAPRQGAPRQALLPARAARQERAHHREAGPPRRGRRGRRREILSAAAPMRWCNAGLSTLLLAFALSWAVAALGGERVLSAVASAQAQIEQRRKEPVVLIRLTDAGRVAFGKFTTENVGRKTEVRVDGRVVMSPVIREPIMFGM